MTLQDDQTNLLCPWDSAVCGGEESDYKTFQASSEPSPEPEGWPDTAAAPGTEVEGKGASEGWTIAKGPHLTNTQTNFPLRGTSRSWQALPSPTSLLQDSRGKRVVRTHQLQPHDYHYQTHQHNTGRGPSICFLHCKHVQPACGIRQNLSLLSLPSPEPLLPLCVRRPGQLVLPAVLMDYHMMSSTELLGWKESARLRGKGRVKAGGSVSLAGR